MLVLETIELETKFNRKDINFRKKKHKSQDSSQKHRRVNFPLKY